MIPIQPTVSDVKGSTYELFRGVSGKQVTLYHRPKGTSFANHFHTGKDPSKNPEIFFLLSGELSIHAENRKTNEQIDVHVRPYTIITIDPYIYHVFVARSDVTFVEYRKTVFDPEHPDSYPKDVYETLDI